MGYASDREWREKNTNKTTTTSEEAVAAETTNNNNQWALPDYGDDTNATPCVLSFFYYNMGDTAVTTIIYDMGPCIYRYYNIVMARRTVQTQRSYRHEDACRTRVSIINYYTIIVTMYLRDIIY